MARKIVLIRHGSVEERYAGKLVGSTDAALSAAGISQCGTISSLISTFNNARFISSPMKRCLQTAEAAGVSSDRIEIVDDLREADFGEWEGVAFSDLSARDPEAAARWARFEPDFSFPGGELISAFMDRVNAAADAMVSDDSETVVAFTHGGVIRFMLCHLLDIDFRKYVVFDVKYADAFVLKAYGKKAVLSSMINHPIPEVE